MADKNVCLTLNPKFTNISKIEAGRWKHWKSFLCTLVIKDKDLSKVTNHRFVFYLLWILGLYIVTSKITAVKSKKGQIHNQKRESVLHLRDYGSSTSVSGHPAEGSLSKTLKPARNYVLRLDLGKVFNTVNKTLLMVKGLGPVLPHIGVQSECLYHTYLLSC